MLIGMIDLGEKRHPAIFKKKEERKIAEVMFLSW